MKTEDVSLVRIKPRVCADCGKSVLAEDTGSYVHEYQLTKDLHKTVHSNLRERVCFSCLRAKIHGLFNRTVQGEDFIDSLPNNLLNPYVRILKKRQWGSVSESMRVLLRAETKAYSREHTQKILREQLAIVVDGKGRHKMITSEDYDVVLTT